jgi:hypothetical protein
MSPSWAKRRHVAALQNYFRRHSPGGDVFEEAGVAEDLELLADFIFDVAVKAD